MGYQLVPKDATAWRKWTLRLSPELRARQGDHDGHPSMLYLLGNVNGIGVSPAS